MAKKGSKTKTEGRGYSDREWTDDRWKRRHEDTEV